MKWATSAVVLAMCAAGYGADPTPETELKALKGSWVAESEELNGVVTPKEKLDRTLVVEGDKATNTFKRGAATHTSEVKLVLDPSKAPKLMDMLGKDFERKAIYKLEDGKLWVCVQHDPKKGRPTGFKTTAGSGYGVAVYVKKK
ncbi:hypothetical protein VT84_23075 [Gemmata sp. SH-PL17]|uniref:TIGR03067 domain-containing protein n=1 Tax=Gemmata sp. SH-PL17 TaxID=1630693 RepID=UPI0004BB0A23|nr:TIGR03067 domain-containing protein [Gemmata sp. SH-PL17]AMV27301.1 hypothetical protein VT84_23075 [Gemmata sp. SH-PL17]